jgi:ketosteroid isomerase-like protein
MIILVLPGCASQTKNQYSPILAPVVVKERVVAEEEIAATTENPVVQEKNVTATAEGPFVLKEVIVAPPTEEPVVPEEVIATPTYETIASEEVIVPPTEEPVVPKEDIATPTGETFIIKEVVVAPPTEEPIAPKEVVTTTNEESIASKEVIIAIPAFDDKNIVQENDEQSEANSVPEENIKILVNTWLTSWESGDIDTYRSCYAPDFRSKKMNLDAWIANKINIRKKSKNISISIDKLQISSQENVATAEFNLNYSSSILQSSGKKTLELKKIKNKWKIYKEVMEP